MTAQRDWWEDPLCPPIPDPPKPPRGAALQCHPIYKGKWISRSITYLAPGSVQRSAAMAIAVTLSAITQQHDVWLSFQRLEGGAVVTSYDYYVTNIPAGATMTIDGIRDAITMAKAGQRPVDASHLVLRSKTGGVFRWPEIDCGGEWRMVVRQISTADPAGLIVNAHAAVKHA